MISLLNEEQKSTPSFFFPPFFGDFNAFPSMLVLGRGSAVSLKSFKDIFLPLPCRNLQLAGGNQEGPGVAASVSHGAAELPPDPQGGDRAGGSLGGLKPREPPELWGYHLKLRIKPRI